MRTMTYLTGALMTSSLLFGQGVQAVETAEQAAVIEIVNKAADILEREGEAGLEKVGALRFDGDNYVFVDDIHGVALMHVAKHLIGQSALHLRDDTGKYFKREFIDTVKTSESEQNGITYYNGSGWVRYRWPRPGEQEFIPKISYVRGILMGDRNVYVGAGIDE